MAPELLRKGGEAPAPALDWWSLGVILVEAAQGTTPFLADTPRQLMLNIVRHPPKLDDAFAGDAALASVVAKLLDKNPASRLQSAAALAKRRFFAGLDFSDLETKRQSPPFVPKVTTCPTDESADLAVEFGDAPHHDGESREDRPSFVFRGEQFKGFSVFASPARPKAARKQPHLTPQVLHPKRRS